MLVACVHAEEEEEEDVSDTARLRRDSVSIVCRRTFSLVNRKFVKQNAYSDIADGHFGSGSDPTPSPESGVFQLLIKLEL